MAQPALFPSLNADVGEDDDAVFGTAQGALLDRVDLANVACGAHAGSPDTIAATVRQCAARGVRVGAHPGYPDREGFGRRALALPTAALVDSLTAQIGAVVTAARELGVRVEHVKPHGALYHVMSDDPAAARLLCGVIDAHAPGAVLVLRARSRALEALRADGVRVWAEGFVDRRYDADGGLVARGVPGASLDSPAEAARQALALAARGDIDTLCIHGDHARALEIASAVRAALVARGSR